MLLILAAECVLQGFGREGKGAGLSIQPETLKTYVFLLFCFRNSPKKCDSDMRVLDLSILFCVRNAVRTRRDAHRSWLMQIPRSETPKAALQREEDHDLI